MCGRVVACVCVSAGLVCALSVWLCVGAGGCIIACAVAWLRLCLVGCVVGGLCAWLGVWLCVGLSVCVD